jgi:hypothetical protein
MTEARVEVRGSRPEHKLKAIYRSWALEIGSLRFEAEAEVRDQKSEVRRPTSRVRSEG